LEDRDFPAVCEAAAERWDVPALVAGIADARGEQTVAVGCERDTLFRIASITKPFTATLALSLVDLDAPTGVWPDDVRVRHLLAHTSGFASECGDLSRFGEDDEALARLVAELPSVRRMVGADEAWSYANSGYWLAGLLSADAAGSTYEEAVQRLVLSPLGLDATSFEEPDVPGTGRGSETSAFPRARRSSGGLTSTVADLLRFGRAQIEDERTTVLRTVRARPPGGVYGLGFFGERVAGTPVWGHGGSYGGFQSSLLLVPSHGAVFAGLTNSGRGAQALREIEDAFFERTLGARRPVVPSVELTHAELASFSGRYANPELRAAVAPGGDGLVVDVTEETTGIAETLSARPVGPRRFEIVGSDADGSRFDFPLDRFVRIGSRLAERAA
jgi:CubicO group peptidase (beta-lactamase class C family)